MKKNGRLSDSPLDLNCKLSIPEAVLFRKLDTESVLLNLDNEMYYGLDEVGTTMLATLESAESIDIAYRHLLTQYEVDSDQLLTDLTELVGNLLEHQLVSISKI
jgi:hypothetical protein